MKQMPTWGWAVFGVGLLVLLTLDLFVHRGDKGASHPRAWAWSILWIAVGLAFAAFVWIVGGTTAAQEYLAAYLIEESLSLDNLFVFLIIFQSLTIPAAYHRTALSWGIWGALVLRALFIFAGAAAIQRWQWVEYIFGGLLLYAAYHAWHKAPTHQEGNKVVAWLARRFPVSEEINTSKFIVQENGKRLVTPLLIAIISLETSDIMFAVDSVPAALSVSRDTFIVYSSNAFAILGLRSLYIVLARSIAQLPYLHYGLGAVLGFAGLKLVMHPWIDIPALVSVGIIIVCIAVAVWASLHARAANTPESWSEEPPSHEAAP